MTLGLAHLLNLGELQMYCDTNPCTNQTECGISVGATIYTASAFRENWGLQT